MTDVIQIQAEHINRKQLLRYFIGDKSGVTRLMWLKRPAIVKFGAFY